MKRHFEKNQISIVEKLYKQHHKQSYASAGGFNSDDDEYEERREQISEALQKNKNRLYQNLSAPELCSDCEGPLFSDAYLWKHFNKPVCNKCRELERNKLIARTEAKTRYLLTDADLDFRKPPLRYISRKNPHNPRYGDMKLYLRSQLETRALEVYGSFASLEEAKQKRDQNREKANERRFEKKIHSMRKEVGEILF
uniref:XPA_C domain-containing protein n=1 Tax=Meloidogyne hapla TaxID=6305 RepID=A0A1I8B657_MELHA